MKGEDYIKLIRGINPTALYPTDMVEAIIGIGTNEAGTVCLAIDCLKCCEILIGQGMDEEEALEFFEFNVIGSYMGEGTPLFVHLSNLGPSSELQSEETPE